MTKSGRKGQMGLVLQKGSSTPELSKDTVQKEREEKGLGNREGPWLSKTLW